jgi:hypothetical protein
MKSEEALAPAHVMNPIPVPSDDRPAARAREVRETLRPIAGAVIASCALALACLWFAVGRDVFAQPRALGAPKRVRIAGTDFPRHATAQPKAKARAGKHAAHRHRTSLRTKLAPTEPSLAAQRPAAQPTELRPKNPAQPANVSSTPPPARPATAPSTPPAAATTVSSLTQPTVSLPTTPSVPSLPPPPPLPALPPVSLPSPPPVAAPQLPSLPTP